MKEIICSGALFYAKKSKRFLFLHRTQGKQKDLWGLVGGTNEDKETPWSALQREIKEEIGETSIIKTIRLFNTHGSALTVTTKVRDSSASTDFEFSTNVVNASDSADMLTFNNILILEEGDILKMQTSQTNVVKMTAAILQITRT